MGEMVERVAKRMCRRFNTDGILPSGTSDNLSRWVDDQVEAEWQDWVDDARAAIAEMREPTEAMYVAGGMVEGEAPDIWQAMIDEALKD